MYHKYHTKGIVLSSKIEGDDSKRLFIFTETFGLINARIQGARHAHSKLRSGAQDFCFGEFSLVSGKSGWKVVSAKTEKNIFELLRYSPLKLTVAANILNLVKKLAGEEARLNDEVGQEIHTPLFGVVSNFLDFMIDAKEENVALAECLVLLRILHTLGYMRHDPDFSIPISSTEIQVRDLETIAPKRSAMIRLINESLKATNLT